MAGFYQAIHHFYVLLAASDHLLFHQSWWCMSLLLQRLCTCVVFVCSAAEVSLLASWLIRCLPVQPGLSEDELGGSEEVHQRFDQQSQRVQHRQHHPGAPTRKYRQREVSLWSDKKNTAHNFWKTSVTTEANIRYSALKNSFRCLSSHFY